MCSGRAVSPLQEHLGPRTRGGRGGPGAGSACARVGKGGLTYTGRILLRFLFLTAFPRGVTVMAQLPVGENLGGRVSTCHNRPSNGSKPSDAAVRAAPGVHVQTPSQRPRGPEASEAQMKPFFVELKGREAAAPAEHVVDPNVTGECSVGTLRGLGWRKDEVMSWGGTCRQVLRGNMRGQAAPRLVWRRGVEVAGLLATVCILFSQHAGCRPHTELRPDGRAQVLVPDFRNPQPRNWVSSYRPRVGSRLVTKESAGSERKCRPPGRVLGAGAVLPGQALGMCMCCVCHTP